MMNFKSIKNILSIVFRNFMGKSPAWYKIFIIISLILNPFLLLIFGKFITGWFILSEFIITLALALQCYPLIPGGLLAIEIVIMGMVSPETVYLEVEHNLEVILLLIFMVAGIYFMKDFLSWLFTKLIFSTKSKTKLSLIFYSAGAFLSAWLDALTVIAVIMTVSTALYEIYSNFSYKIRVTDEVTDEERENLVKKDIADFEGFLRNILMHSAIGTATGGVSTVIGEPQNLLIGSIMKWNFSKFIFTMAHISIPVIIAGVVMVIVTEKYKVFGYGYQLPQRVRNILKEDNDKKQKNRITNDYVRLFIQGLIAALLIISLALHLAPVGLLGISIIILLTAFLGKVSEHQIGKAFEESMPFTSLLVVFFAVVGMINSIELFKPIISYALAKQGTEQIYSFFFASGILSSISDNVFVATIYIQEAQKAFNSGIINQQQFDNLAIAINAGTNIPSIATPNGQAAFLFLLTSPLAQKIELSYYSMFKMALPYTIVLTIVATTFLNIKWL